MSYSINYREPSVIKATDKRKKSRIPIMTAVFFLLFMLVVKAFWEKGDERLSRILWSQDLVVLERAVQYIFAAVEHGQPFPEAVQAFCREIIHEAMSVG